MVKTILILPATLPSNPQKMALERLMGTLVSGKHGYEDVGVQAINLIDGIELLRHRGIKDMAPLAERIASLNEFAKKSGTSLALIFKASLYEDVHMRISPTIKLHTNIADVNVLKEYSSKMKATFAKNGYNIESLDADVHLFNLLPPEFSSLAIATILIDYPSISRPDPQDCLDFAHAVDAGIWEIRHFMSHRLAIVAPE